MWAQSNAEYGRSCGRRAHGRSLVVALMNVEAPTKDRHGMRSGWREEVSPVWKPTVDLGQGSTECGLEPACRRTRGGGLVVTPVGTA